MPDFTVIDGGGEKHDFNAEMAQTDFRNLTIELFRAIARGDGNSFRVMDLVINFYKHATDSDATVHQLVDPVISELHQVAFRDESSSRFDVNTMDVVRDALRLAAETMARDSFAKGRRSQRESEMRRSIERYMLDHEELARENGNRSYLTDLADRHLGKWKPKKETKPSSNVRKSRRKRVTPPIEL
jgi:hypothetical protein